MKSGHAKFVICTSTLAQGVNFPIRYLIVTATQQGREQISVRDFQNLIGRAGRAGMYTEGSVIFAAPVLYDQRAQNRYRWLAATRLLNPANSEPTRSSILDLFEPYQQVYPAIVLTFQPEWLNLAFADRAYLEATVDAIVGQYPLVIPNEIQGYVRDRARAVQSIAAYLVAHVNFETEGFLDHVTQLAANTLAYHLADDETRHKLISVFRLTAEALVANADANFRLLIRRSPLPAADIRELTGWLHANIELLRTAAENGTLLETVFAHVRPLIAAKSLSSISDQAQILPALRAWTEGQTFSQIQELLAAANVRVSGDKVTVEHAVALCEGAFGYDLAMAIAALSDLAAPIDEGLQQSISLLQKNVKYGLENAAQFAFFEAGFADRIVTQALAAAFPFVGTRAAARQACRQHRQAMEAILLPFPAYFRAVHEELLA